MGTEVCRKLKFAAYLRLKKLHAALDETITDANINVETNAEVFAALVQLLYAKSILLVILNEMCQLRRISTYRLNKKFG